jgi:curli biogenesis system outer membrane secretion channel CsgG
MRAFLANFHGACVIPVTALVLGFSSPIVQAQDISQAPLPYFQEKKDKQVPVPEDPVKLGQVKDELWLKIQYPEFAGYKPRLGVVASVNKESVDPNLRYLIESGQVDATQELRGYENIVRQALGKTNQFIMVERINQDVVLAEQDLGASGRVEETSAASSGRMKGSDFLVTVTVLEENPEKESKDIQVGAGGIWSSGMAGGIIGSSGKVAYYKLSVSVSDSETGEIVADWIEHGTAKGSGKSFLGGGVKGLTKSVVGGGTKYSSEKDPSLSDAFQVAANKIAYLTAKKLADQPWQGSVTSAADGVVKINGGSSIGLKAGLELEVFKKGEQETDPETGEVLSSNLTSIGRIRIEKVEEKLSLCKIIEGCDGVGRADVVKLERRKK